MIRHKLLMTVSLLAPIACADGWKPLPDQKPDPEHTSGPASVQTATQDEDPQGIGKATGSDDAPIQIAQYPSVPHEDRHGNLWFSTAFEGLVRYDGKEFVTFTTEDDLGGNTVRDILEDEDGVLWIGTSGGVTRYDGDTFETLTEYVGVIPKYSFTEDGDHRDIWDVLKDRQGTLWIATLDGLFRHDGSAFTPFPLPATETLPNYEFTPKMVYDIYEDKGGVLWFGTDGAGVVRYDGKNMTVFTAKTHGLTSDRVCTTIQDKRGDYWFGTSDGGVSHYDGETFTTYLRNTTYSEAMGWGRVMAIHEDQSGNLWFGKAGPVRGATRYDGETFRHFSEKDGLGDGHIPSIGEDRSGNLWFGTSAGVYRFDGERFENFTRDD